MIKNLGFRLYCYGSLIVLIGAIVWAVKDVGLSASALPVLISLFSIVPFSFLIGFGSLIGLADLGVRLFKYIHIKSCKNAAN